MVHWRIGSNPKESVRINGHLAVVDLKNRAIFPDVNARNVPAAYQR